MKTILQVDDDPNDVFLVQHALKKMGVANPVQVANDGQRAIDYLQGTGEFADREAFPYPCLVLMDLKLPYVMGLDVLRWIRAQPTSLIVIMLSASAEGSDITEAYRLGANAFLTKPSEARTLEDMVAAIKAFWLTHNTLPPKPLSESPQHRMSLWTPPDTKSLFGADDPREFPRNGDGPSGPRHAESSSNQRRLQGSLAQSKTSRPLTKRQAEVVQLIAAGHSSREIAQELALSLKTVEKHRQALMNKLDIHEVATLTRYAISKGLVQCSVAPIGMSSAEETLTHA